MQLNRRLIQRAGLIVLGAAVLLVGGLLAYRAIKGPATRVAAFTEHNVAVEIWLEKDPVAGARLTGVFTPTEPEFHLYSKDLPRDGLQGVGRPTLLEVAASDQVRPAGPLTADEAEEINYVEILNIGFPVYPAGPVTLHLPIVISTGSGDVPADVSVTYMACKGGACLPPIIDKHVSVTLPTE